MRREEDAKAAARRGESIASTLESTIPALALCLGGAILAGVVFVVVTWIGLPPTDGAKQAPGLLGLALLWLDPFLYLVLVPWVLAGALAAFLLWLLFLRRTNPRRSAALVTTCVIAAIVVTVPLSTRAGVAGAFAALAGSVLLARGSPWCRIEPNGSR